jgi:hypothetical protein
VLDCSSPRFAPNAERDEFCNGFVRLLRRVVEQGQLRRLLFPQGFDFTHGSVFINGSPGAYHFPVLSYLVGQTARLSNLTILSFKDCVFESGVYKHLSFLYGRADSALRSELVKLLVLLPALRALDCTGSDLSLRMFEDAVPALLDQGNQLDPPDIFVKRVVLPTGHRFSHRHEHKDVYYWARFCAKCGDYGIPLSLRQMCSRPLSCELLHTEPQLCLLCDEWFCSATVAETANVFQKSNSAIMNSLPRQALPCLNFHRCVERYPRTLAVCPFTRVYDPERIKFCFWCSRWTTTSTTKASCATCGICCDYCNMCVVPRHAGFSASNKSVIRMNELNAGQCRGCDRFFCRNCPHDFDACFECTWGSTD